MASADPQDSVQAREVQFIQLMLEQLQGVERHTFSRDLSERMHDILLYRDDEEKLRRHITDFSEWVESWIVTMQLRMSGDFQTQSRDFQTRLASEDLGDPVDAEGLKNLLSL